MTFFVLLQSKSGGGGDFASFVHKKVVVPSLCGDVPEVLLSIIDELEVGSGYFPISPRYCWEILIWMELSGKFYVSSSYLSF